MPETVDAGSPKLKLQRHYPVAVEKVWQAWTDPATLTRWFGPGEPDSVQVAEVDLRVGGRYHIGFTTQDGERHDVSGIYEVVEPPHRLAFSWAWKSTPERVSRVVIQLVPARGGGTDLAFRHEGFVDQAARDNHERGWLPTFDKLARFLEEGTGPGSRPGPLIADR